MDPWGSCVELPMAIADTTHRTLNSAEQVAQLALENQFLAAIFYGLSFLQSTFKVASHEGYFRRTEGG